MAVRGLQYRFVSSMPTSDFLTALFSLLQTAGCSSKNWIVVIALKNEDWIGFPFRNSQNNTRNSLGENNTVTVKLEVLELRFSWVRDNLPFFLYSFFYDIRSGAHDTVKIPQDLQIQWIYQGYVDQISRNQVRKLLIQCNTNSSDKHCIPTYFNVQLDVSYTVVPVRFFSQALAVNWFRWRIPDELPTWPDSTIDRGDIEALELDNVSSI